MSAYRILVAPGLLLAVLGSSCPRATDLRLDAPILALAEIPTVNVVAPAPATQAPVVAENKPALLDPVTLTAMPPELNDPSLVEEVEEAEPEEAPSDPLAVPPADPGDKTPRLASVAKETWVFAEPRWKARKLGYLRAGALVKRAERPAGTAGCSGGWYHIEPKGFVCVGSGASLDVEHAVAVAQSVRPDRFDMPYTYAMSRFPPPTLYARLPTRAEMEKTEGDLRSHLRKYTAMMREASFVPPPEPEQVPAFLEGFAALPSFANQYRSPDALVVEHARARSGYALTTTFEHENRRFGLTTDMSLLPLDRARVIKPSSFHGVVLSDEMTLPVAFVRSHHAVRFSAEGAGVLRGRMLGFREPIAVTTERKRVAGVTYVVAEDGGLLREDQVTVIEPLKQPPGWAAGGRRWLDISILRQSLVAYEGERPVYVTLVSTGADGLGDPKKTHSTIQGAFLIHTKHLAITMDGDDVGDEFDLRDVPFVQYFTEGFALHGAYWHDDFGIPRSHGCVNLSPRDAAWLFGFTTPDVPEGWHGSLSLKHGTLVYIHP